MVNFIILFIVGWVIMTIILYPVFTVAVLMKFLCATLLVIGIVSLFMPSCSGRGTYAVLKALGPH